jgi:hypothetical protein
MNAWHVIGWMIILGVLAYALILLIESINKK